MGFESWYGFFGSGFNLAVHGTTEGEQFALHQVLVILLKKTAFFSTNDRPQLSHRVLGVCTL